MPYAAGTLKYVISGDMPSGTKFAFGFQCTGGSGAVDTQLSAGLGIIKAWLEGDDSANFRALMSPATVCTQIAGYHYPGGGAADQSDLTETSAAGTGTGRLPDQCALVVSFRTANNTRSGRGRMFVPLTGATVGNDGQVGGALIDLVAADVQGLFEGLGGSASGLPQTPVVASSTHSINRPITRLVVDSRPDVQRHRAKGESITHTKVIDL